MPITKILVLFKSWMDQRKVWQMTLQVCLFVLCTILPWHAKILHDQDLLLLYFFQKWKAYLHPVYVIAILMFFFHADTSTAGSSSTSANRKSKTPWSLLRLVMCAPFSFHHFHQRWKKFARKYILSVCTFSL